MFSRSHGSQCERQARFTSGNQTIKVIREVDHTRVDLQIQVNQRAVGMPGPSLDMIEEHLGMFWNERGSQPPIGKLAC